MLRLKKRFLFTNAENRPRLVVHQQGQSRTTEAALADLCALEKEAGIQARSATSKKDIRK